MKNGNGTILLEIEFVTWKDKINELCGLGKWEEAIELCRKIFKVCNVIAVFQHFCRENLELLSESQL